VTSAPTVSVITISLNDLDGLKRTVRSVQAQIYGGNIEHIVIDGGSGDAVVDYLSRHEPGFAYWQSKPDGGRYDAMNQGIAHASGELLWFMNSGDCFFDPDAVAEVVEAISGHEPRDVWGYGINNEIGPDGRSVRRHAPIPFKMRRFLIRGEPIPHQAAFFGSSVVSKLGGYDVDFGLVADQLFMYRAALVREPIIIQKVLCNFDLSGVGSTRSKGDHLRDYQRMCDVLNYFTLGGRRTSLAYMRCQESFFRAKHAASRAVKALLRLSQKPWGG
jgi:glycosyltransferase involved in cell wall biosynthesis